MTDTKNTVSLKQKQQQTALAVKNTVFNFGDLDSLLVICEKIASTDFSTIKTKEGVLTALLTGRELGIPPMASLTNIYPINNRPTLGIKIILAILMKNNIHYEIVKDYKPEYIYKLPNSDTLTQEEYEQNKDKYYVVTGETSQEYVRAKPAELTLLIRANKPCDYVTTVKFTRYVVLPNKELKTLTQLFSFRFTEAQARGYLEKDNWIKMLKTMMRTRALSGGAYLIAPDLLQNIVETTELADSYTEYSVVVDEEGEVQDIQNATDSQ